MIRPGPRRPGTRAVRGFTLLELGIAVIVVSLVAGVLLDRLARYQEAAERATMEATLRLIRTGLQLRLAELILARREAEAASLERENPVRWLAVPPADYGGLYREPAQPGHWYFDPRARELVYVVKFGNRLEFVEPPADGVLRFRVRITRTALEAAGQRIIAVNGVALAPVKRYRWL